VVAKPRTGKLLMGCKMADECIEDCPGSLENEGMADGSQGRVEYLVLWARRWVVDSHVTRYGTGRPRVYVDRLHCCIKEPDLREWSKRQARVEQHSRRSSGHFGCDSRGRGELREPTGPGVNQSLLPRLLHALPSKTSEPLLPIIFISCQR
jgi:hypothetical protein